MIDQGKSLFIHLAAIKPFMRQFSDFLSGVRVRLCYGGPLAAVTSGIWSLDFGER
jgi:hypothetical protein